MQFRSRQIRPPIYSLKQSKLRRRRVIRYSILYFTLLVIFVGLMVGPSVAGSKIPLDSLEKLASDMALPGLFQPSGQNNNDTQNRTETGTAAASYSGVGVKATSTASDAESTDSSEKLKFRFL